MGLSIHYSGYLKKADSLPELIREIKDIAEVYQWKYQVFDATFPDGQFSNTLNFENFYGINFTPPKSETISIVFLSNGRMICPVRVLIADPEELEDENAWIYTNSVKTQFAGEVVHQLIIQFFRHLNKKYFRNFEMMDESYYWETNDEETMKKQFKEYNMLLDNFTLAIETFPLNEGENIINYFERLMEYINSLKK